MTPPLTATGVGLCALGLLVMLIVGAFVPDRADIRWPARFFDVGFALFAVALMCWLAFAACAFFVKCLFHGA